MLSMKSVIVIFNALLVMVGCLIALELLNRSVFGLAALGLSGFAYDIYQFVKNKFS